MGAAVKRAADELVDLVSALHTVAIEADVEVAGAGALRLLQDPTAHGLPRQSIRASERTRP